MGNSFINSGTTLGFVDDCAPRNRASVFRAFCAAECEYESGFLITWLSNLLLTI